MEVAPFLGLLVRPSASYPLMALVCRARSFSLGSPASARSIGRPGGCRGWIGGAVLVTLLSGCGGSSPPADVLGSSPPTESSSAPSPSSSEPFERVVQVFMPPKRTASKGAVPLVVLVPGGTWLSADPSGYAGLADKLAEDGAAVVTTTYRTQTEGATFPVPIEDVVCAVNESAARVAESGQEVGPVVIVGHSSGAQLAALAALVGDQYQAGCSSPHVPVDGLVGLAGPYDLVTLGEGAAPLFDSSLAEDPEAWTAASPSTRSPIGRTSRCCCSTARLTTRSRRRRQRTSPRPSKRPGTGSPWTCSRT